MVEETYKAFRKEELEYQYNPRVSVPEFPELAKKRSEASRKVRDRVKSFLNVAYGDTPRQTLDIFPPDRPGGPVLLFFHGGYWRSGAKEENCAFVRTFTDRGATVVVIEYDLCPQVTVTDIVRQARNAIAWTYRNIIRYGGDPSKLYVCGHSAGGHLTAMALAHDWQKEGLPPDLIKGASPTSGVFDLEMVTHVSVNEEIRMTQEIAKRNSPFLNPPRVNCPVLVAVGGAEPKGWQQMSEDYFQFCKEQGLKCEYLVVPGANHYTLSDHMADPKSPLAQAMLKQMGLQ
jgi:arylformamidase